MKKLKRTGFAGSFWIFSKSLVPAYSVLKSSWLCMCLVVSCSNRDSLVCTKELSHVNSSQHVAYSGVLVVVHNKECVCSNISYQISEVGKRERCATQSSEEISCESAPWGEAEITRMVQGALEIKHNTTGISDLMQFSRKCMNEISLAETLFWHIKSESHINTSCTYLAS